MSSLYRTGEVIVIIHRSVRLPGKDGGYLGDLHVVKLNNNLLGKNEENFYHFVTSLPSLHALEARQNGLSSLYPPTAWNSRCIRDLDFCGNKIEEVCRRTLIFLHMLSSFLPIAQS